MSIDPRTIKEILQMQILNKSSLLTGSEAAPADESEFTEMLNTLLAQGQPAEEAADPADVIKSVPLKPATTSPIYAAATRFMDAQQQQASGSLVSKPSAFDPMIQAASRRFGVDSSLVKAVIDAESSFNPQAVSHAGAKGLMQLMDATGQGLGVTNPFDPAQNIEGGTRYLSNLLRKYDGNQGMALAAYNAGSGRVNKLGVTNDQELMDKLHLLPKETQQYVRKVLNLQQQYQA